MAATPKTESRLWVKDSRSWVLLRVQRLKTSTPQVVSAGDSLVLTINGNPLSSGQKPTRQFLSDLYNTDPKRRSLRCRMLRQSYIPLEHGIFRDCARQVGDRIRPPPCLWHWRLDGGSAQ